MNGLWDKYCDMSEQCYMESMLGNSSLKTWMETYDTLKEALLLEWKHNPEFPKEYDEVSWELEEELECCFDMAGWIEDFFDELELFDAWDIVLEKAKDIMNLFAWEEIRPDEFKLRVGKALLEQAKQQETLEYCQNWYAENENNWFAATALLSALTSIKDYEKAEALVEKFIDAETICDDEKELFFGNAQQLYEVQGKEEKARWIEQKINTYKRKEKERQDKIWSELKAMFDFNDEDELPF